MSNQAQATVLLIQRDAMRFAEADADANMELDWDQFYAMQPLKVRRERRPAEIREVELRHDPRAARQLRRRATGAAAHVWRSLVVVQAKGLRPEGRRATAGPRWMMSEM